MAKKWNHKCIKRQGFSDSCSQIWFYNSQNALKKCWKPCFRYYFSKNNSSKSKLNPCLQCDEDINGPIFKKLAGRTRRNSGIKSAIKRSHISKIKKRKSRRKSRRSRAINPKPLRLCPKKSKRKKSKRKKSKRKKK